MDPGPAVLRVKVFGQVAGNVSGRCVDISIVYCSCSHQVFLGTVYCTGEGVVQEQISAPPPSLLPSLPQILNFYFLFCETIYLFIPSFWITVSIILFEGMLGGAVYANAFYSISVEARHSINPLLTIRNILKKLAETMY